MTAPVDVLAVMDSLSQANVGPLEREAIKGVRAAVAELVEAATAVAGPGVGIAPRDRKLRALRAALAKLGGAA